jgi:hypothetical protein
VLYRDVILALIPVLMLVGLFILAAFWISRRAHGRELAHRERLAMIEKGLIPPAELYPDVPAFPLDHPGAPTGVPLSTAASRFRSAGVMLVGLGVAVALVIALAADQAAIGVGIGGAIAAIGAAMIVNAVLGAREHTTSTTRPDTPPLPVDLHARE